MSNNTKYTHIFIAYAYEDEAALDTLLSHLNGLKNTTIWTKKDLTGGAEFEKITENELEKAGITLLLISKDFVAGNEYENIKKQLRKQTYTKVIPILLRPYAWEDDPFLQNRHPLPSDRKFITGSATSNEEEAYVKVYNELKGIINGKKIISSSPTKGSKSFLSKFALGILLLIGLGLIGSLFFKHISLEFIQSDKSLFTMEDSLFKILIVRFEDNLNEDNETYCIGRSIQENLIDLEVNKSLPITSIYADTITSPRHPDYAKAIQKHHNADVLIYGLANKIQENCTSANICFRHIVADTIMANVDVPDDIIKVKHDREYEMISHSDIEEGKLSVDKQSMEAWIRHLIALKDDETTVAIATIEEMLGDTLGLNAKEKAMRFYNQGKTYQKLKEYKKAILSFSEAIELKSDYAEVYYRQGITYRTLNQFEKAIQNYDKAIELDSTYAMAYNNRGVIYSNELKEYKKAITNFNKAIELNPNEITYYYNRGITFNRLKDYEKAIKDYNKAIELNSNYAMAYENRGNTYRALKQYKKAIEDFNKTIELSPDNAMAYNNRGATYSNELKEYGKAILDFDKAIELDTNDAMTYYNRGVTYSRLKEHEKAILDFDVVIELDTNYAMAYYNRGLSYSKSKGYKKAMQDYNKAIGLDSTYAMSYNNRGVIYSNELKEYKKAILNFDKAIELNPNNLTAYENRGITHIRLKKYNKAILDFDVVIELNRNYAGAYYNRGLAYRRLKKYEKAIEDYDSAIRLNPDNKKAKVARKHTQQKLLQSNKQ